MKISVAAPKKRLRSQSALDASDTHKELKVNAVVRVEVLKGHHPRFLQAHSVGQRGRALVRVGGNVVAFGGPG